MREEDEGRAADMVRKRCLSDPETHTHSHTYTLCPLPPPTARLREHHRDGHPQVPQREEPSQGEEGESREKMIFYHKNLLKIRVVVGSN